MTPAERIAKINELKVLVYDRSRLINKTNEEIAALNQQIQLLEQEQQPNA